MIDIEELKESLEEYSKAKRELDESTNLLSLVGKKGHSDGKWHKHPSVEVKVAYQENIGGTNYHESKALAREFNKIISEDWDKIIEKAHSRLVNKLHKSLIKFKKYEIKEN